MKCPNCKNKILQKSGSKTQLRTVGRLVFQDGSAEAQCYWCKTLVKGLPVTISPDAQITAERFYLKK